MKSENLPELQFEPEQETSNDITNTPTTVDTEWSDYVLSHFTKDEKFKGNPTVDGLRRVAELLIGEIIEQTTQIIQYPTPENEKRATVIHTIMFSDCGRIKRFDGAADAYLGNTTKEFGQNPVALAETRSEGRALKRALKLKKIVAAEELSDGPPQNDEMITNNQINFIDILCNTTRGSNINVEKFIKSEYPKINHINELKHSESLILQEKLSLYQQDKSKIPENILGYSDVWRNNFVQQIGEEK